MRRDIPAGLSALIAVCVIGQGCVTGIIARPNLKKLAYDSDGVLRYDGRKVEGIKLELPWYQEMWPDSPSEWGFTLLTAGAAAAMSSGGGGGSSGSSTADAAVPSTTTATSTSSKPRTRPSTSTSTTTSTSTDSGGGSSSPAPAPPPSGGGTELPF